MASTRKSIMVALFGAVLVLSACARQGPSSGSGTAPSAPSAVPASALSQPKVLTAGVFGDPITLDPQLTGALLDMIPVSQIFDTLLRYDLKFTLGPHLAESVDEVNATNYRIKLRKGVKFHDGTEMKAEDVKYSLLRNIDPKLAVRYRWMEPVDTITVVDDYNLEVKLKTPTPLFKHWLANYQTAIVPKAYVERVGAATFGREPIGSGPFKLVEWKKDDRVVFATNKEYFLGASPLDQVVFRTIPEQSTMTLELEKGSIDLVQGVFQDDLQRLKSNPKLTVGTVPQLTYRYLNMNGGAEGSGVKRVTPFKDVRVRQAVYHVVNWDAVMKSVAPFPEFGSREFCHMPPTSLWDMEAECKSLWPQPAYDPEKAKRLLAEAGYPNGFSTSITLWQEEYQRLAVPIQADLKKVGIDMKINMVEIGVWVAAVNSGDYDMFAGFWPGADAADPQPWLYSLFHSSQFGPPGNRHRYSNAEVDRLLGAAIAATGTARIDNFRAAQRLIIKDMPTIPIYRTHAVMAWNKRVKGFEPDPFTGWAGGHYRLWHPPSIKVDVQD